MQSLVDIQLKYDTTSDKPMYRERGADTWVPFPSGGTSIAKIIFYCGYDAIKTTSDSYTATYKNTAFAAYDSSNNILVSGGRGTIKNEGSSYTQFGTITDWCNLAGNVYGAIQVTALENIVIDGSALASGSSRTFAYNSGNHTITKA